jgi:soluble lytic murein transglycosylase-like protein
MRFCFRLGAGLGIAVALTAAGLPRRDRVTSVIQADPRTGKLVRRLVVQAAPAKPAAQPAAAPAASANPAAPQAAASATPAPAASPCSGSACIPSHLQSAVERAAAQHSVPVELIHSVIQVESNYNPYAVSRKGARGLMQLIPETARRFGVSDAFDPAENIQGGAKYLRYLLDLYDGNYTLALAAYNAGEGAVARYGNVPPYPETRNYVQLVGRRLEANKPPAAPAAAPSPKPEQKREPAAPPGPSPIQEIVAADGTVRYVSQ